MRANPDLNPQRRESQNQRVKNYLIENGWATNEELRCDLGISRGGTPAVHSLRELNTPIHTFINSREDTIYYMNGQISEKWAPYAIMTESGLKFSDEITQKDLAKLNLLPSKETAQKQ
jgi:hypothetical protein